MTQTYYDIVEISQRRMSVVLASHRQKLAGTGSISRSVCENKCVNRNRVICDPVHVV